MLTTSNIDQLVSHTNIKCTSLLTCMHVYVTMLHLSFGKTCFLRMNNQ